MPPSDEIELKQFLTILKKRIGIVIAVTLFSLLTSIVFSFFLMEKVYETTVLLKIGSYDDKLIEKAPAIAEKIRSVSFLSEVNVKNRLVNSPKELLDLRKKIGADFLEEENTDLIKITFQENTPEKSYRLAEAVTTNLLEQHQKFIDNQKNILQNYVSEMKKNVEQIENEIRKSENMMRKLNLNSEAESRTFVGYLENIENSRNRSNEMRKEIANAELNLLSRFRYTSFVVSPQKPDQPSKPNKKLNFLISLLVGLTFGLIVAFFVENYFTVSPKDAFLNQR